MPPYTPLSEPDTGPTKSVSFSITPSYHTSAHGAEHDGASPIVMGLRHSFTPSSTKELKKLLIYISGQANLLELTGDKNVQPLSLHNNYIYKTHPHDSVTDSLNPYTLFHSLLSYLVLSYRL